MDIVKRHKDTAAPEQLTKTKGLRPKRLTVYIETTATARLTAPAPRLAYCADRGDKPADSKMDDE